MRTPSKQTIAQHTRRELLALLLGSLACVVILTISLADRPAPQIAGFAPSVLLLLSALVIGFAIGGIALVDFPDGASTARDA